MNRRRVCVCCGKEIPESELRISPDPNLCNACVKLYDDTANKLTGKTDLAPPRNIEDRLPKKPVVRID